MENQSGEKKLIFIRHAQSKYNSAIDKVMKALKDKDETEAMKEIAKVKFSEDFIDCSISEEGQKQAEQVAEKMKDRKVSLVITSPLTRCLQTTKIIFGNHSSNPKILVCPLIKEILSSSCDIPRPVQEVQKDFEDYDFSLLDEFPIKDFWYMDVSTNEEKKKEFYEEFYKTYPNKEEAIKNVQKFTAEKMLAHFPKEYEALVDLNARVIKAKKWLKERLNEKQDDGEMVVVTHSKFLQSLIAKEYGQLGEFIGSRRLVNCEVLEYHL